MKRIIGDKRFDTQTVTHVDELTNNHHYRDFRFEETNIYRTRSGDWFLAGHDGPASR